MEILRAGESFSIINCKNHTRDWFAWNNLMPPGPVSVHVVGEVQVPNPGVFAQLIPHIPPGINPTILLLGLVLVQRPGIWPRVLSWTKVEYSEITVEKKYSEVHVLCNGEVIEKVEIIDVH